MSATPVGDRVRWGVVATGSIAASFADDLAATADAEVVAVASRSLDRARAFADDRGVSRAYDDVDAMFADGDLDVVYVATPHPQHVAPTRAALEAGVPVLCEKPLTHDLASGRELVDLARDRGVFLAEAMWMRCNPLIDEARHLVADGAIGRLRVIDADLGFPAAYDENGRLWAPELGGGALLDVGVYPVSFARAFLPAAPELLGVAGSLAPTGVDADATLLLQGVDGVQARVSCSLLAPMPATGTLIGTGGTIRFDAALNRSPRRVLRRVDGTEEEALLDLDVPGFGFQIAEVHRCLRAGLTESPMLPLDEALEVLATLEEARRRLGAV